MKSLTTKVLSFSFALLFAAGCATVTDANLDIPETNEPTVETTTGETKNWHFHGLILLYNCQSNVLK